MYAKGGVFYTSEKFHKLPQNSGGGGGISNKSFIQTPINWLVSHFQGIDKIIRIVKTRDLYSTLFKIAIILSWPVVQPLKDAISDRVWRTYL